MLTLECNLWFSTPSLRIQSQYLMQTIILISMLWPGFKKGDLFPWHVGYRKWTLKFWTQFLHQYYFVQRSYSRAHLPCTPPVLPFVLLTGLPQFHLSPFRCVAILSLPLFPSRLCWSSSGLLRRPTLRGIVSGIGTVCGRCSGVPAGAASGCRVPGEARRSSVQTSLSVNLQVPAWLPPGGAVPAHILEGSFDARSVKPHFRCWRCAYKFVCRCICWARSPFIDP